MNKISPTLCPHQIHLRHHDAMLADMSAGAALGKALTRELGIQHVLSALPVLDAHLAEASVQFLGAHAKFLRQLCGRDAVDGVQH